MDEQEIFAAITAGLDPAFYLDVYPDVVLTGHDPVRHYIDYGHDELRDPCAWFSTKSYFDDYPDVRRLGVNAFAHFLLIGRSEGRTPKRSALASIPPLLEWAIDQCDERSVGGWVWAPRTPWYRVSLQLLVDGREHDILVADRCRTDLVELMRGDGCYGFDIELPPAPAGRGAIDLIAGGYGISLFRNRSPLDWLG